MGTNVLAAFGLTLVAGLATAVGSLAALFMKRTDTKMIAGTLGFSAGVMLYVSLVEILAKGKTFLESDMGAIKGSWFNVLFFFGGILIIALIDFCIPSAEAELTDGKSLRLDKRSFTTALALAIHNFPEGLVTFTSALQSPELGIAIATAIAIHNIPEGIATAMPIYYATNKRSMAFIISFFSGITEPIGAIVGYLLLRPFLTDSVFGAVFSAIAGVMVFIAVEELLPAARELEKSYATTIGFAAGMLVIAVSLILLA